MKKIRVILIGESNVGKTSLINLLGNKYFKVSNFSGTTVEKNIASLKYKNHEIEFIDLPGIYSIDEYAQTEINLLVKRKIQENKYDIILNIASATILDRNLNLSMDLLEQKSKLILAINMIDELGDASINSELLSDILNIDVIQISTKNSTNITPLLDTIVKVYSEDLKINTFKYPKALEQELNMIESFLSTNSNYLTDKSLDVALAYIGVKKSELKDRYIAMKLLEKDTEITKIVSFLHFYNPLKKLLDNARSRIYNYYDTQDLLYLKKELKQNLAHSLFLQTTENFVHKSTLTNKIDKLLISNLSGIAIFLFIMWVIFESTFYIGSIPMLYIEEGFNILGTFLGPLIDSPNLKSLIIGGILPGLSAVMMFLPNILILFLGITLLETTGYLTRVSFLLDGVLQKFGLHGQSIIPLIIGFGCTVPAYMATRMLESKKDKLITLFSLGFISCSAKLPVYVLFISAFFKPSASGNILFGIYIFGVLVALLSAKFLNKTIFKASKETYIMELPQYRLPSFKLIYMSVWLKSISYVKKAGIYITLISMLIWFASSYPKYDVVDSNTRFYKLEHSYLGQLGKSLEPIFKPLGFDWKMSVSLMSGMAAKEVIVSTLSILYVVEQNNSNNNELIKKLRVSIDFASAVSFIVFITLYLPCFAATIVFTKESGEIKYLFYLVFFTLSFSWLASYSAYNIVRMMT
ncbi:MAG: ferrous iron transport protein B [Sulfurimonas sp.]|nr:ferrous iron transport protein B [Sulfurimonas sp.]